MQDLIDRGREFDLWSKMHKKPLKDLSSGGRGCNDQVCILNQSFYSNENRWIKNKWGRQLGNHC